MSSTLKRTATRLLAAVALTLQAAAPASAAHVEAVLSRVGGNTWDISFTVGADAGQTVEAFSVYFDWTQVSNIQVLASPLDWDSIAIQADSGLASDGLFDSLALGAGIGEGTSLGGFVARFEWAGATGPAGLRYSVNDPLNFDTLETGDVTLTTDGGGTVPEPAPGALVALGLLAAVMASKRAMPQAT